LNAKFFSTKIPEQINPLSMFTFLSENIIYMDYDGISNSVTSLNVNTMTNAQDSWRNRTENEVSTLQSVLGEANYTSFENAMNLASEATTYEEAQSRLVEASVILENAKTSGTGQSFEEVETLAIGKAMNSVSASRNTIAMFQTM